MATKTKAPKAESYEPCEVCGAPLDDGQRYCVNCATRRREAGNPTGRYFANAARRARRASPDGAPAAAAPPSAGRAAAVLLLLLLPIAVAVGVLVGRGNGNNDDKLLAAINNVGTTGAATGTSLASAPATLTSDFTLDKGFTVKLSTLPAGSDQAAADAAKSDAKSKGAADVGIIAPADFTLTPADPSGDYVLYSGQFKTKAEAEQALKKLKKSFPKATVVAVKRNASGEGAVVANTDFGAVHKVAGSKVTPQKVQQDTQQLDQFNKQTGDSYVQSQKGLPDVVAVGGGGSSAGPTGSGD
jgi:SPOR domain